MATDLRQYPSDLLKRFIDANSLAKRKHGPRNMHIGDLSASSVRLSDLYLHPHADDLAWSASSVFQFLVQASVPAPAQSAKVKSTKPSPLPRLRAYSRQRARRSRGEQDMVQPTLERE